MKFWILKMDFLIGILQASLSCTQPRFGLAHFEFGFIELAKTP